MRVNWNYLGSAWLVALSLLNVYLAGSNSTQALAAMVCWWQAWLMFDRGLKQQFRASRNSK